MPKNFFYDQLAEGIQAFEEARFDLALRCFQEAAVMEFGRPEPWYWMGRLHEDRMHKVEAAHCYFMACDMLPRFTQARDALIRLGYLGQNENPGLEQGTVLSGELQAHL